MPGIFSAAQCGFSCISTDVLGTTLVSSYGPTPGAGLVGCTFIGNPVGIRPSDGKARTLSNGPYGAVRWITIFPVALLAVMPLIVLALPVAYAFAPTMIGVMNVLAPPHGILTARSTV